jgi:hypothetical protein
LNNQIYIFSGLGADERVFQKLDFAGLTITFIHWIIPQERETIEDYATRLLSQIKTTKPPNQFYLVFSWGVFWPLYFEKKN